ncbi:MAG: hypothetical protein DVB22_002914 [Verrucomicrobia bacterium]|nr:MAG: hypothetical protein DVB22_002914 [Verrucomicrobiota bacterium]
MSAVFAANLPFMIVGERWVEGLRCGFGPCRDDRSGNRQWRRDAAAHAAGVTTEDQWYEYDGLYQVGEFQRGTLSGSDRELLGHHHGESESGLDLRKRSGSAEKYLAALHPRG